MKPAATTRTSTRSPRRLPTEIHEGRLRVGSGLVVEGDLLVVHFAISAVHEGKILGIGPTGTELSWTGVAVDRCDGAGRIAEAWLYPDWLATLGQLGVLPADVAY